MTAEFLAGIDDNLGVSVYILDDTNQALLVDTTGDGICDSINPDVDPEEGVTTGGAVVIDMQGLVGQSMPSQNNASGNYRPVTGTDFDDEPVIPMCRAPIPPSEVFSPVFPSQICASSELTWVMTSVHSNSVRTIYGKPPITGATCHGDSWDFQTSIDDGWACVAVRARDRVGNVGVSPVQRNCFVSSAISTACDNVMVGEYMPNDANVPSCTDGCTPPPTLASSGFNTITLVN